MYRKDGPTEMKPVGETEFLQRMTDKTATGQGEKTVVTAGIIGHADLTLGPAVARVLEAHLAASPERFRGIRHSVAWDASPAITIWSPKPRSGWMSDSRSALGSRACRNTA